MISQYGSVDNFMSSIKDERELLSDPNKSLSASEIRLGKGKTVKKFLSDLAVKLQPLWEAEKNFNNCRRPHIQLTVW